MTDTVTTDHKEGPLPAPRPSRFQDEAMAKSTPDFNTLIIEFARWMFEWNGKPWYVAVPSIILGSSIVLSMVIFVVGLPSMVASALVIDKWNEKSNIDRAHELEMFKIQSDIELKKMDRTMLGDGALNTLNKIAENVQTITHRVDQMNADISLVKREQAAIRAQQQGLNRRLEQVQPPQAQRRY